MEILIFILLALVLTLLACVLSLRKGFTSLREQVGVVLATQKEYSERLTALENGAVPDHEKAKEAAKATNDFMAGVAGIMGFDPFVALKRAKNPEGGSDE